jgi:hypothetical protein
MKFALQNADSIMTNCETGENIEQTVSRNLRIQHHYNKIYIAKYPGT